MKQVAPIQQQTSQFRIEVVRSDQGVAQYTFYDGATKVLSASGFWDDATPWESGTYAAARGDDRFKNPRWDFINQPNERTVIQLHQGSSTAQSHGCLVAPGSFLKAVDAYIVASGQPNTIILDVQNDFDVKLDISTSVAKVEEGNVVTVTVTLTGAGAVGGLSKDIYVRVDLDKGSTATTDDYEMFSPNLLNLWTGKNSAGGARFDTSALHLKIPAGQTSASFEVKTKADDDKVDETATFKVGDYAIFWKNDPSGKGLLYSDSKTPKLLIENADKATVTITPAESPDDGELHINGGSGSYPASIRVTPGKSYHYAFEAYSIPDQITISDNTGNYLSTGFISGFRSGDFVINAKSTGELSILVTGNQNRGTAWVLDITPNTATAPSLWLAAGAAAAAAAPASVTPGSDILFDLTAGQSTSLSASLTAGKTYSIVVAPAAGTEIDPSIVVTNSVAGETLQLGNFFGTGNAAGVILADRSETVTIQVSGGTGEVRFIFKEVQAADLNVFALEMGQRLLPEMTEPDGGATGFTVMRFGDVSAAGSVSWRLVPSGTNPVDAADFGGQLPGGTLAFAAGQVQAVISLHVPLDALSEGPEGFRIELFNPVGSGLATVATNGIGTTAEGAAIDGFFAPFEYVGTIDHDTAFGGPPDDHLAGQNGDDALSGLGGGDLLEGEAGDDVLEGGEGDDILDGGSESDSASYSGAANPVAVDLAVAGRQYTRGAGFDTLIGIENLIGSALGDSLRGDSAANLLDGGGGADIMTGRGGDDIYVIDDALDTVVEGSGAGSDTVRSSISLALPNNVEDLLLLGTNSIDGTCNGLGNRMTGNDAGNRLTGGGGNDALSGMAGNDVLDGGVGADLMAGGADNDSYVVDQSGDRVEEALNAGTDEVRSSVTFILPANTETLILTGTAAINGSGNALSNALIGNNGSNVLDGGGSADRMEGGLGNDVYLVDSGDLVIEGTNAGADEVRTALFAYTLAANVEKLVGTASWGQVLTGNGLANLIAGGSGHDVLDGGGGADQLAGGLGNDVYFVDGGDVVTEAANGGTDEIRTRLADSTAAANVEQLTGLLNTGQTLRGNALGNVIAGGAGADRMIGGLGNDIYLVGAGDNVIESAGGGTDEVRTGLAAYTLAAEVERLMGTAASGQTLTGNALANTIAGGAGHDILSGGGGADQLAGGPGNDLYFIDSGDVVVEAAGAGTDEMRTALPDTMAAANVEKLTGLLATGQTLRGNALNNVIAGGSGADRMIGGLGDDVFIIGAGDNVIEAAGGGTDEVRTDLTAYTLTADVERLIGTSATGQSLTGNGLANAIVGGTGNDMLNGGSGADQLAGGLGDDIYLVDAGDVVIERTGGGTDEVRTALAAYTLTAAVERLVGLSAAGQVLTGNGLANVIFGGAGNDVLNGGLGGDQMAGGLGNDIYFVDAGDTVTEAANSGIDEIRTTIADTTAGASVENLTGLLNTGQTLRGNGLANLFAGGTGADRFVGGGGNDVYLVGAGDIVVEKAGEGSDEVRTALASYALTADVEKLTGTSAMGQALTGNALANVLTGGAGNDVIDGGAGVDQMAGGLGNDVYFVRDFGDNVTDTGGIDEIRTALPDTTAGAGIENLTGLLNTGQTLRGNGLGNVIAGGTGADRMVGGLGDDVYVVGSGDNVIEIAGEGTDEVRTGLAAYTLGAELERLTGTSAAEQALTGNALANVIAGGAGVDRLTGGGGADSFRYLAVTESNALARDHIIDFMPGTDKIDLSAIDASRSLGGDQAFSWIGSSAFSKTAGELRATQVGSQWVVEGDINGDGFADLVIALTLQGPTPLGASDFML